jgi:hypothetical protein
MRAKGNTYMMLMVKSEGKRPVEKPGRRWVDNTEMDQRDIAWAVIDWIDLTQYRDQWRALLNTTVNLRVR